MSALDELDVDIGCRHRIDCIPMIMMMTIVTKVVYSTYVHDVCINRLKERVDACVRIGCFVV